MKRARNIVGGGGAMEWACECGGVIEYARISVQPAE